MVDPGTEVHLHGVPAGGWGGKLPSENLRYPAVFHAGGSFHGSLVAGHFNNDSKLDYVVTSQGSSGEVNVLLNSAPPPTQPRRASCCARTNWWTHS